MKRIGVVVPAHDEEVLLPGCLDHLDVARRWLARLAPDTETRVVVVADRCLDRTPGIAAARADVDHILLDARSVGAARAAGAERLLTGPAPVDWIASTDADSLVPRHWLTWHLAALRTGYDGLLGTVWPEGTALSALESAVWLGRHDLSDGHPHVHGANLGISASAYRAVGGFRPIPAHEDADLVARVRSAGYRVLSSGGGRVVTSDRLTGRAPGGFADYLLQLRTAAYALPEDDERGSVPAFSG